jgi:putative Holliday junction resolvase
VLEQATGLPVVLWDERRTTIDAHQILRAPARTPKSAKRWRTPWRRR